MNTNNEPAIIQAADVKMGDRVAVLWNDLHFVKGFDAFSKRGLITEMDHDWFRVGDGEDSSIVFHAAIIELRRFA
jgi:hypothetical protein